MWTISSLLLKQLNKSVLFTMINVRPILNQALLVFDYVRDIVALMETCLGAIEISDVFKVRSILCKVS